MKQIQIKGVMIPKVLELLENKRGGNQPILSFHSSQTPDADVYNLYLDDLLDYIKDTKEQAAKDKAKEIYREFIEMEENPCNSREEIYQAVFGKRGVEVE